MEKLTVGSLFSGIGGLELGLEWTGGFRTVWQCENDPYASRVLAKHWPGVKRYTDIRDVSFPERVDVIAGGFPCQDVSLAGARKGLEGKRSTLWGEMFRLICEVKPRWVLAENVPGLLSSDDGRFFGNILRDLAGAGFDAEWGVLSAAGVGAPHLRRRVFLLGRNTDSRGWTGNGAKREVPKREDTVAKRIVPEVADSEGTGLLPRGAGIGQEEKHPELVERGLLSISDHHGLEEQRNERISGRETDSASDASWWSVEPNVGRVAHGVPSRTHRLKCLGNAVVPQVAEKVGEMILKLSPETQQRAGEETK